MARQGHQIAIAGERGPAHALFEQAGWPWIDVPLSGGPLALLRARRQLREYLSEHPVDLLHAHYRARNTGRSVRSSGQRRPAGTNRRRRCCIPFTCRTWFPAGRENDYSMILVITRTPPVNKPGNG